jgi:hypothetical protein
MVHLSYLGRIKAAQINLICTRMNAKFRGRGKRLMPFIFLNWQQQQVVREEDINKTDLEAGWG